MRKTMLSGLPNATSRSYESEASREQRRGKRKRDKLISASSVNEKQKMLKASLLSRDHRPCARQSLISFIIYLFSSSSHARFSYAVFIKHHFSREEGIQVPRSAIIRVPRQSSIAPFLPSARNCVKHCNIDKYPCPIEFTIISIVPFRSLMGRSQCFYADRENNAAHTLWWKNLHSTCHTSLPFIRSGNNRTIRKKNQPFPHFGWYREYVSTTDHKTRLLRPMEIYRSKSIA